MFRELHLSDKNSLLVDDIVLEILTFSWSTRWLILFSVMKMKLSISDQFSEKWFTIKKWNILANVRSLLFPSCRANQVYVVYVWFKQRGVVDSRQHWESVPYNGVYKPLLIKYPKVVVVIRFLVANNNIL